MKIRSEILQVALEVAKEKNIREDIILEAMEVAMQKAGKNRYGVEHNIEAKINRENGTIRLMKVIEVVATKADIIDDVNQMTLVEAMKKNPNILVGENLYIDLPPVNFGRVSTQTARQIILQKIRDAERISQYDLFEERLHTIVIGVVKRIEYGNVIVEVDNTGAVLLKKETIYKERYRVGGKIKALIINVKKETRGPQIFLSRSHPLFLEMLLREEVPEINEGLIEIKAIAREAGQSSKVAVYSTDSFIDAVGTVIGARGSKIQNVSSEVKGERIDVIEWAEDPAEFVVKIFNGINVNKVILDEENKKMEVIVHDDDLSFAIGRRGQNVRLASQLLGWSVDILSESQEISKRQENFERLSEVFMNSLDVDEDIAKFLIDAGYETIEELAYSSIEEIQEIEAFDEYTANELKGRSIEFLEEKQQKNIDYLRSLNISQDLIDFEHINDKQLRILAEHGEVKTLDDLADLSGNELLEILGSEEMSLESANNIILAARKHWFADEQEEEQNLSGEEQEEQNLSGEEQEEQTLSGEEQEEQNLSGEEQEEQNLSGEEQEEQNLSGEEQEEQNLSGEEQEEQNLSGEEQEEQNLSGEEQGEQNLSGEEQEEQNLSGEEQEEQNLSGEEQEEQNLSGEEQEERTLPS